MKRTLTDGEYVALAKLNRESESDLCPSCGEPFQREEWYDLLPDESTETEGGRLVPLATCCPDCVDEWFAADAPCVQLCADGSYEPA